MMRFLILTLFLFSFLFSKDVNSQILKKLNEIENNQKLIKQEMQLRFEAIDKRFEMMNENFNQRFETLTNFILALTAGIFGLIGFMIWDRKSVLEKQKGSVI